MKQFVVPYLMSSHPGCTLRDAVELAEYLRDTGHEPEQVQDFYPTPSTLSTVMYYTGLDPRTMEKVYVPKNPHEKAMQRALMQYRNPANYALVKEALVKAGRTDLIGFTPQCLIRPYPPKAPRRDAEKPEKTARRATEAAANRRAEKSRAAGAEGMTARPVLFAETVSYSFPYELNEVEEWNIQPIM